LNDSQRRAIVIDENRHLLIAGAGSGKTTTIVSKVAYLIEKKGVDPNDIILTTFTNDAASELQKRVKNIVDLNVKAKTIHSFGREIIAHAENRKPSLAIAGFFVFPLFVLTFICED
jgi:DNA helicase-4